ncbi:hypothetical protein M409DRAFT_68274 [Zasmidium cellare ATCC 36951]|uniref:Rab-GAP TBC domain-containing protein n=1 Tax=Zasmidium cellare ATCC 36951 TaxID=1080233 RepID=A0A6A6C908_ZASCE|nr:uncharacterized protein M409DRAFT_68274 [Zasmidium cellare ATCC 36951]KAF2163667.1 hypothetical protein M409DRAFT_68274 [Zasmidium cellare ATCC 36951]
MPSAEPAVVEETSRVDTPTNDNPPADEASTPTQETPTKPLPVFITTTTLHDDEPAEQLCSSPQPETPTGPTTPITPNDEHDLSRDSMASIALSETSLDYDHLSTEQVEDVLATPRVSGARRHLRKVSSLDILQNKWAPPERQSTLFDTSDESLQMPMSAIEFHGGRDPWARDSNDFSVDAMNQDRRPTNATLDSIDLLEPGLSTPASISDGSNRRSDGSSDEEVQVNWKALDQTEQQEKEDKDIPAGAEDESTAFLLARLEQENAKIEADSKTAASKSSTRARAASRPPSMAQLKKLVAGKETPSIRYSLASDSGMAEVPPMTELEFWTAIVQDYPSTATRLPTLTTTKMRSGIPPPLRGVVWSSMAGARDKDLEDAFERLLGEKSPYEGIINKDVGRSFPGVELFRDAEGEGQKMLGRVLKCFSLQDKDIGYCQGLGFLVGPLLMNMGEREAFCVLVRLMDHYSLRPSFLPSLSGLHMRIYQFSTLLRQHHRKLHDHLAELGVEPAYLSQWFLSCFAVTCPLEMLFRIYDVIFAEGANETVMRVALALMRRHEEKMLGSTEFEEVMQLLLSREMWDCYGGDADEMVDDFTSLGDIVTHARLAELEKEYENQSAETVGQSAGFLPDVQAAASRFLGRIWAPGHAHTPSKATTATAHTPSPSVTTLSPSSAEKDAPTSGYSFFGRPTSFLRRSPSKQSMSAVNDSNSSEDSTSVAGSSAVSLTSTAPTEPETPTADAYGAMRESVADSSKSVVPGTPSVHSRETQELHAQIEDLLTAIGEMQREHAQLAAMLQREKEDRGEDQRVMRQLVGKIRKDDKEDRRKTMPPPQKKAELEVPEKKCRPLSVGDHSEVELTGENKKPKDELQELVEKAQERLQTSVRFSASLETKAQLRSTLARTRERLGAAETQSRELTVRLDSAESAVLTFQAESEDLRSEVKELRTRVADDFKSRQKLEHQLNELKAQARSVERKERLQRAESLNEVPTLSRKDSSPESKVRKGSVSSLPPGSVSNAGGLRELKLGRRDSSSSVQSLRNSSRNPTPIQTELAPPIIRTDGASPDGPSPPALSPDLTTPAPTNVPTLPSGLPVPRTGFARRTSSLAAQEVFATTQHEPVPEEALLLEFVNAKTSEAQAKQEVDELKKALSVGKRKQEEALNQLRAEMEAAKAEAAKAVEAAQAAKAETEAVRLSQLSTAGTPLFSLPPTPYLENPNSIGSGSSGSPASGTPAEEKTPDIALPKKAETAPAPTTGGWFWQRRTASKSSVPLPPTKEGE